MGQKIHPRGLRLGITQLNKERWIARANVTRSRWLLQDEAMRLYLKETFDKSGMDVKKRAGLIEVYMVRQQAGIDIDTRDHVNVIDVKIFAADPWQICDPNDDEALALLGKKLASICDKKRMPGMWLGRPEFRVFPHLYSMKDPNHQAYMIAMVLVHELENRASFRAAFKKALREIQTIQYAERPQKKRAQRKGKFKGLNKSKEPNANEPNEPQPLEKKALTVLKGVKIQLSGRLNGAEIARTEWFKQGRVPLQTLRADIDYVSQTAKTTHGILGVKVWTFRGEKRR